MLINHLQQSVTWQYNQKSGLIKLIFYKFKIFCLYQNKERFSSDATPPGRNPYSAVPAISRYSLATSASAAQRSASRERSSRSFSALSLQGIHRRR